MLLHAWITEVFKIDKQLVVQCRAVVRVGVIGGVFDPYIEVGIVIVI